MSFKENETLVLLEPVPDERLLAWLTEFYGKPVRISHREVLRHRDLSFVARLHIEDGLPETLIYKLVLPPWDIEQDLHERVLIPSISNSAQLYLSANHGPLTAMFLEDLGSRYLKDEASAELASRVGEDLAKMHRSYCYRTDELMQVGVLRTLFPIDYVDHVNVMIEKLSSWRLINSAQGQDLITVAQRLASALAGEPISLVHGDFYAENVVLRSERIFVIDWSWFTILGVPLMDLATLASDHPKNGALIQFREQCIESYCYESGSPLADVKALLPAGEALSRLYFLQWLVERRSRGILGTTVGPVDNLIQAVVDEIAGRLKLIPV